MSESSTDVTSSSSSFDVNSSDEVILDVSAEFASLPLGFCIDSGGSATKLVYRAKDDYEQGKPKHSNVRGRLRLRYISNDNDNSITELIEFLRDHCDILDSSCCSQIQTDDNDDVDKTVWFITGLGCQNFKTRLEETFNIRTRIISELNGSTTASAFYVNDSSGEYCQRVLPLSKPALDKVLHTMSWTLPFYAAFQTFDQITVGPAQDPEKDFNPELYSKKLLTTDAKSLSEELQVTSLQPPFAFIIIGSAMSLSIRKEDGLIQFGGFLCIAGKTFLTLGKTLTGAKDFDELISMASRGDSRKVDIMGVDLKNKNHKEPDFYSIMMDEQLVFNLGKLGEQKYKDSYTKQDIAAAVVHMFATIIVNTSLSFAQLNRINLVVFTGSYLNHPYMREIFEEIFYVNSLSLPFTGGEIIKMAVLSNPGFVCALGAWQYNWEIQQKKNKDRYEQQQS